MLEQWIEDEIVAKKGKSNGCNKEVGEKEDQKLVSEKFYILHKRYQRRVL